MEFDLSKLCFLEKRSGQNNRKVALEYSYDGQRFLVYPQVFPFGGGDSEDVTLHYSIDNEILSSLVNDEQWLSSALAFFEKDYYARCAEQE